MVAHHDEKVTPVYAITVAKDGPKFHESVVGDTAEPGCLGGLHKVCRKTPIEDLINILELPYRTGMGAGWAIDRPLIDQTGLKEKYDFNTDYGLDPGRGEAAIDAIVYSAVAAVKAPGLKLEPTTHIYDVVVIDHIERVPTGN